MSALVESDALVAELLRSATGDTVTAVGSLEALDDHLDRHPEEHAVLVGPSVPAQDAAALAERYRVTRPAVGVVLVRHSVDAEVLALALRSGMREVVASSDATAIAQAVARTHDVAKALGGPAGGAAQGRGPSGHVVTVFATKGGVGKSVVATNLAVALADAGRRVCLVDLDVNGGDVAVMLGLNPQHTLADLSALGGELDAGGVDSLLAKHSPGLTVLAAPVQTGASVPVDRVGPLLDVLRSMVDVVVVDTGGTFDDAGLAALDHAELLLLVGTLDIPSLKSLKLATGTLDLLNLPRERWRLVLNRADAKVGLTVAEFEDVLGLTAGTTLPSSREVLAAVNRGEAIVRCHASQPASKALVRLAGEVLDTFDRPAATAPAAARKSSGREAPRQGLLRRSRTGKVS